MNIIVFYQKIRVNFYFFKIIVLFLCEKNNIQMDLIHSNTFSTNQCKKSEKSEVTTKYKNNTKSN